MKRILVADHDDEMFALTKKALQDSYEVLTLPTGKELLESLRHYPPDLIVLTLSDGDTRSYQSYFIIRRVPELEERPVIFLSMGCDIQQEQKVLSMGAADYITLPITEQLLLHRVNTAVELSELRRERPYVERYQDAISISFAELVEFRDETTGGHLKNTTTYFNIMLHAAMKHDAYREAIASEDIGVLLRSATLHDIGKIGINDDILRKGSPLDYDEFEFMKTHTTLGKQAFEKIIKETGGARWLYLAMDMAYCHHERWDGTGYPNGLKGEDIPLYARMLTIADVYDALTSRRAYKEPFSHKKAMEIIIEGKGSYFDPALVCIFIEANEQFELQLIENKRDQLS